jgi:hypothetical protein
MKVYAVVLETDQEYEFDYEVFGIYQNENDAMDKLADIMQEIEAYSKTIPKSTGNDEVDRKNWYSYSDSFPYRIGENEVFNGYVQEFELL